jgi:hypothetical protein
LAIDGSLVWGTPENSLLVTSSLPSFLPNTVSDELIRVGTEKEGGMWVLRGEA